MVSACVDRSSHEFCSVHGLRVVSGTGRDAVSISQQSSSGFWMGAHTPYRDPNLLLNDESHASTFGDGSRDSISTNHAAPPIGDCRIVR
jgi:hypothetical protein